MLSVVFVVLFFAVNWTYQVVRKPSELWFPISGQLYKDPTETWRAYGSLFERHSTAVMTPELLAALAQVEGSGNPIVRTYWRFGLTHEPFEMYRPASSAVGMYQITDGTFAEARRYCVHRHRRRGRALVRVAVVLVQRAVYAHGAVARGRDDGGVSRCRSLTGPRPLSAPSRDARAEADLATMMHLCGAGAAAEYARRGLQRRRGQRCGSHDARTYVTRVTSMQDASRRSRVPERER